MIRVDKPTRVEWALAGLTVFMFTEAFLSKALSPGAADAQAADNASKILRYLWLPFYGFTVLGLIAAGKQTWTALWRSPWLVLLLVLASASILWSIDPGLTGRRAFALIATTLFGVYLAVRYNWLEALRLLAAVWFALLIATLISGIVAPSFAIVQDVHSGAWAGGWWEKNQLGGHAARASFLFGFMAWRDEPLRRMWGAATVLAVLLVLLSTSATALLGTLLGFGVLASAWWMRHGKRFSIVLAWAATAFVGVVGMGLAFAPEFMLGLIGRDVTLTGRTDIWRELFLALSENPLEGFGYMAFWGSGSEPRYWITQALDWPAPSAHNGWLDLAISVGGIGVVLFAIEFAVSGWRATRQSIQSPTGVFAIGLIAQFFLFAMSESIILGQNSIIWVSYVMVSAKLAMHAADRKASQPIAPGFQAAHQSVARYPQAAE